MPTTILPEFPSIDTDPTLTKAIESACKKMPPLWPLKNFVAVNPFVGLSQMDFADTCRLIRRVAHADMTLPPADYKQAFEREEIRDADLREASSMHGGTWSVEALHKWIESPSECESPCLTLADAMDSSSGSRWSGLITEEISKWCAAYYDEGQALWRMPWRSLPLFKAWKNGAEWDRTPEVSGLCGFRASIQSLPDDPMQAIAGIIRHLQIPSGQWEDFFHRQLMTIRGWAGHVQYLVREKSLRGNSDTSMFQILAIRLAYDFALHEAFGLCRGFPAFSELAEPPQKVPARVIWQDALEIAHRRKLMAMLKEASPSGIAESARPWFQAVFCIDVRSEVFRRALESVAPWAETIGFAGFFGFPIEVVPPTLDKGGARCPVLLLPACRVHETVPGSTPAEEHAHERAVQTNIDVSGVWKTFKSAAITCFPFVETLGLVYGATLVRDSLSVTHEKSSAPHGYGLDELPDTSGFGISLDARINMAEGALRNMGLTRNFSRLVLLCGHGSRTANNPFGSSLDCGACGGHAGDANARIAAAILNDSAVHAALAERGIPIPEDTVFIAGLHNTTTDEIELFDKQAVPASHRSDLDDLLIALKAAGIIAREERARSLGIKTSHAASLQAAFEQRTRDWAQVRPEWGLAGNQAFIAAPRSRTRHLRLDGRAFLHNYDHTKDPENLTLELILCAPMVVANWINLQYFASSANNAVFGSGNKVLHNVVGKIGVIEGNGGDLRTGLPWQSVHNGKDLAHLPLRLNVIIEAPRERIEAILAKHESVRQLVENSWLHLHASEDEGRKLLHRLPGGGWKLLL